jgi:hypothetical protein
MKQMPWIQNIVHNIPIHMMLKLQPSHGTYLEMREVNSILHSSVENTEFVEVEVVNIKNVFDDPTRVVEAEHQTIFRGVLESRLPPQEETLSRMTADVGTVLVAVTFTTTWTLSLVTCYLLYHPKVLLELKEELAFAMPGGMSTPLSEIKNLPSLTAVVQECYRLSYGTRDSNSLLQMRSSFIPITMGRAGRFRKTYVSNPIPDNASIDNFCRHRSE